MKSLPIMPSLSARELSGSTQTIHAAEKEQWMQSLTNGQILKGRIMRHYGEGRYGVSFAGQERIVDSTVPLSIGELLSGRVIGVSEKSVSMRLIFNSSSGAAAQEKLINQTHEGSKLHAVMVAEMTNSRVQLDKLQIALIEKAAQKYSQPITAIKIGLYLTKLGIPLSIELIHLLSKRVERASSFANIFPSEDISELLNLSSIKGNESADIEYAWVVQYLADFFNEQHLENTERDSDEDVSMETHLIDDVSAENRNHFSINEGALDTSRRLEAYLSRMLNVQTGASLQHRFQTFPLLIDGRIIEFDVAFFDHSEEPVNVEGVKSRHLKFCLTTKFGEVMLNANIVNDRLSLKVAADSEWLIKEFKQYDIDLSNNLKNAGWVLDSTDYSGESNFSPPAIEVINHVMAQESLQVFM